MSPAERHSADQQIGPSTPRPPCPAAPPALVNQPHWLPQTPTPCRTAPDDRPPASHTESPPLPHTHPHPIRPPGTPAPAAHPAARNTPYQQSRPRPEPPPAPPPP